MASSKSLLAQPSFSSTLPEEDEEDPEMQQDLADFKSWLDEMQKEQAPVVVMMNPPVAAPAPQQPASSSSSVCGPV